MEALCLDEGKMRQMEAMPIRARKMHFKRAEEYFEEREIAVNSLFLNENDKNNDFFNRKPSIVEG